MTFDDLYTCMLDKKHLEDVIDRHTDHVYGKYHYELHLATEELDKFGERLTKITVTSADLEASVAEAGTVSPQGSKRGCMTDRCLGPRVDGQLTARTHTFEWTRHGERSVIEVDDAGYNVLTWQMRKEEIAVNFGGACLRSPFPEEIKLNKQIDNWYKNEWLGMDEKLRSSIVQGMSVFLGIFIDPPIARVFCPKNPALMTEAEKAKLMPPLLDVIESGKVLALNMPAGANPALSRAAGVMLKQSWLSTLLLRPKAMKKNPKKFFRPAVFICDEYQSFATCGEEDPAGDEKAFALTRQSRCIPIVATQSIASLKAVLGEGESWRALLQTLRSRIFLSLADDFSLKTASDLLGQVNRMKASYSLSENTGRAAASIFSGRIGGGSASAGLSKSYAEKREPLFHQRDINLLGTCQAIAQIFDGNKMRDATRVYLKPDYRPRDEPYWRWYEEMERESAA